MVWAGVGPLHVWLEIMIFDWALCIVWHIHSVSQSVTTQHIFEWFSTVVKHAESDLNSPCTVKIPGLRKVKSKSNQYVNRGSVNHTFPGRLCQDQLCIHHSLQDLCIQFKKEIKDRNKDREGDRHVTTHMGGCTQNTRRRRRGELVFDLWKKSEKTIWPPLWSLTTPESYLLPCQNFTTAHPGLVVCPYVPSRCSAGEEVKGWQVPGGSSEERRGQISERSSSRGLWEEQAAWWWWWWWWDGGAQYG